jgi:hypothetical protein
MAPAAGTGKADDGIKRGSNGTKRQDSPEQRSTAKSTILVFALARDTWFEKHIAHGPAMGAAGASRATSVHVPHILYKFDA